MTAKSYWPSALNHNIRSYTSLQLPAQLPAQPDKEDSSTAYLMRVSQHTSQHLDIKDSLPRNGNKESSLANYKTSRLVQQNLHLHHHGYVREAELVQGGLHNWSAHHLLDSSLLPIRAHNDDNHVSQDVKLQGDGGQDNARIVHMVSLCNESPRRKIQLEVQLGLGQHPPILWGWNIPWITFSAKKSLPENHSSVNSQVPSKSYLLMKSQVHNTMALLRGVKQHSVLWEVHQADLHHLQVRAVQVGHQFPDESSAVHQQPSNQLQGTMANQEADSRRGEGVNTSLLHLPYQQDLAQHRAVVHDDHMVEESVPKLSRWATYRWPTCNDPARKRSQ